MSNQVEKFAEEVEAAIAAARVSLPEGSRTARLIDQNAAWGDIAQAARMDGLDELADEIDDAEAEWWEEEKEGMSKIPEAMEIFALSTTRDEAHAVLPKGKFNVNDWSYEEGINLGSSVIDIDEAEKLAPGTWRIERATWGAYVSGPGYLARWIKLTVEQAS